MKTINQAMMLLFFNRRFGSKTRACQSSKDQLEFEGYTIRLLPAMGGTYGYDIRKGKELIVCQFHNPFTASPMALSRKEDAFKLAQWQITQLKEGKPLYSEQSLIRGSNLKLPPSLEQRLQLQGSRGPVINHHLPEKVAADLHITIRL